MCSPSTLHLVEPYVITTIDNRLSVPYGPNPAFEVGWLGYLCISEACTRIYPYEGPVGAYNYRSGDVGRVRTGIEQFFSSACLAQEWSIAFL